MVNIIPKQGFMARAIREYYKDLEKVPHNDRTFQNALRHGWRCYNKYQQTSENGLEEFEEPSKKRFRKEGGGKKAHAPEFRDSLFEWFIGK